MYDANTISAYFGFLQMTTFMLGLYHSNIVERVRIVAPLSVLDSWTKELKRSGLERRVQSYNDSGGRGLQIVQEVIFHFNSRCVLCIYLLVNFNIFPFFRKEGFC